MDGDAHGRERSAARNA